MYRKILLLVYASLIDSSFESISNRSCSENYDQTNAEIPTNIQNLVPEETKSASRKWISHLFAEAKVKFDMKNVSQKCREDFQIFKSYLHDNQTTWAVRMMESSEWPSVGILAGVTHHLGCWKQCVNVDGVNFKGQYCLVKSTVIINYTEVWKLQATENVIRVPENYSAWDLVKQSEKINSYLPRNELYWAMCIPSSCNNTDLRVSLTDTLSPIFERNNMSIRIEVDPVNCQIKKEITEYSKSFTYTKNFYFLLVAIVVLASIYDLLWRRDEKGNDHGWPIIIFRSFSIKQTIRDLIHSASTDMMSMHIFRITMICLIIHGHRFLYTLEFPAFQTEHLEVVSDKTEINVLDNFFLISGFLMYRRNLKLFEKAGTRHFFLYITFRYLRIIPMYMLVISFLTSIMPYLGDGPLWQIYSSRSFSTCSSTWWMNLLLINNVQVSQGKCYYASWHLATEFQLSIVGAFLLLIYTKNRQLGKFAFATTAVACAVAVGFAAYSMNFVGFYITNLRYMRKTYMHPTEKGSFYMAFYPRLNTYLLGMGTAMLVNALRERKFKFTPLQILLMNAITLVIVHWIHFYGISALGRDKLSISDIIFAALQRPLYLALTAVFMCVSSVGITSRSGRKTITEDRKESDNPNIATTKKSRVNTRNWVKTLILWKGFVPLGRLTFGAFLTSNVWQYYRIYSQQNTSAVKNQFDMDILAFGDTIVSFSLAFVLYLISEGPVNGITKEIKRRAYGGYV